MKYNVNKLAQAYADNISTRSKTLKIKKTTNYDFDAYNDIEYLDAIFDLNQAFDKVDDIEVSEKFLKGEWVVVSRGELYYADLSPVVGSEQGGLRPVLIIQNNIGNKYSPTVIIAAITSQISKAKLPTHIELRKEKSNFFRFYKTTTYHFWKRNKL